MIALPISEKAKINPNDYIEIMFWGTKGIMDITSIEVEEKKLFLDELKAFKSGFTVGANFAQGVH